MFLSILVLDAFQHFSKRFTVLLQAKALVYHQIISLNLWFKPLLEVGEDIDLGQWLLGGPQLILTAGHRFVTHQL